ncbi:MAG: efflux transporter outer membrane subunit [Verrucomicrobia bacterium]|nr:MAG: efflux transporter outer membrane subunit [Verrucomicrobiota bacterium]
MNPRLLLLPTALLLGSCRIGPDFKLPLASGSNQWKETRNSTTQHLPDDWWKLFGDAKLNRLVARSLAANNDLAAAKARVETARALVGVDRARLFPTLDVAASAGIDRTSGHVASLPFMKLTNEDYRGSFKLAYDPDLWGRNRRLLESSTAQADASAALFDAQRLGLATEVARQYFVLRGLDVQDAVVRDTLVSRKEALDLQQTKTDAGLTDGLATSRARTELELANNDLAVVQRQRGSAEHALAVLCGSRPADFALPAKVVNPPLPTILAGLPASVLLRRPDVRAAALHLRAVNAQIGVAQTAFYPNFSLLGEAGLESLNAANFLSAESRILSLGAGAVAPVFNAGANQSRLAAARSSYDEALAGYRQTLLVALREVEDALADLKGLARSRSALDAALASSKDTRQLSQERYNQGLTSYLEVVDADRTVLQTRLALSAVDAQHRISLAALAKALGGGWK